MASVWPGTLQEKILEAGFDHQIGETAIETEMDVSLPKTRRRYTKGVDVFSCSIDLDVDLYDTIYNFFNTTLAGGTGTFLFDHPITGIESEFQFVGSPRFSSLGGRIFRVSMSWRLLP